MMETEINKDFYYNENGYIVFTEHYLLNRGFCCGNGCRHCPYDKEKDVKDLNAKQQSTKQ